MAKATLTFVKGKGDSDICSNSVDSLVNVPPGLCLPWASWHPDGVGRRSLGVRRDSRVIDQTARKSSYTQSRSQEGATWLQGWEGA